MEDRGQWLQTFLGGKFFPFGPRAEDVHIEDIAHALSLICRFGGHCKCHYSVCHHSILVSNYLLETGASIDDQLRGLLHDSAEYVLSDMIRPIKIMFPEFSAAEDN